MPAQIARDLPRLRVDRRIGNGRFVIDLIQATIVKRSTT